MYTSPIADIQLKSWYDSKICKDSMAVNLFQWLYRVEDADLDLSIYVESSEGDTSLLHQEILFPTRTCPVLSVQTAH